MVSPRIPRRKEPVMIQVLLDTSITAIAITVIAVVLYVIVNVAIDQYKNM